MEGVLIYRFKILVISNSIFGVVITTFSSLTNKFTVSNVTITNIYIHCKWPSLPQFHFVNLDETPFNFLFPSFSTYIYIYIYSPFLPSFLERYSFPFAKNLSCFHRLNKLRLPILLQITSIFDWLWNSN